MQNKGFSSDWLDKLKNNVNIVTVISRYLTLNRRGNSYWACCPFHHEKTPSFSVNEQGQFYHCFGCGVGGDALRFIQNIEGVEFHDAVKILADIAGIEVPEFEGEKEYIEKKKHRELLQEICRQTAIFYNKELTGKYGGQGRDYLESRGVEKSTITKLGLGYSSNWTSLPKYLLSHKFNENDIIEAGVCGKNANGLYDELAKRVIFPVIDHTGKVVGFSGRALNKDALAKYKNTRATPLFNKSSNIYCINFLRKARLTKNYAILVEGQMDVVALQQAGFSNAIATMGTAFNKNHIQTLSRFVDSVIVCFDGDAAGQKAAAKSLEPLLTEGFDIKVLELPDGMDPDEYIKKYGADAYQNLIDNATPVYEYEIKSEAKKLDLSDRDNISKFVDNCIKILVGIKKESEKQVYVDLVAKISGVPRETILRQLLTTKVSVKDDNNSQKVHQVQVAKSKNYLAEQFVLASIIHKKPYVAGVENDDFVNNNFRDVYAYLEKNNFPIASKLFDAFDIDENEDIKNVVNFDFSKVVNCEKEFEGCLNILKLDKLIAKQNQINSQIQNCTNDEVKLALLKRANEISKEINEKKTLLNKVG